MSKLTKRTTLYFNPAVFQGIYQATSKSDFIRLLNESV